MRNPQTIVKQLISLGFTQYEIFEHTKIPQPTISRILNCPNINPRWHTVEALNSFLETVSKFEDENI